jgi:hypothetical protein
LGFEVTEQPAAAAADAIAAHVLLELGITITVSGADLPDPAWDALDRWLQGSTVGGAIGRERGDELNLLHGQGVVRYV